MQFVLFSATCFEVVRSAKIYSFLNAFVDNLKICKFRRLKHSYKATRGTLPRRISCATLYFGLITNTYCAIPNYNHGVRLIAGQIAILLSQIHKLRVVFSIDMLRQPLLSLIFLSMRSMHIVCMRMYIIFIPLFLSMR